ncbi:MAG: hypothetical protein IKE22_00225 [Atopobiaceae bacterium]|nr:hypothetical protein [Atopobiaceae bacterium]
MDRLEAFEKMLADLPQQAELEAQRMRELEAQGRKKSATYRQYLSNRLLYKAMLDKYREYGLL